MRSPENAPTPPERPRLEILRRKPQRISVTVSQATYERLLTMSDEQGRSLSNLCAYLLEAASSD